MSLVRLIFEANSAPAASGLHNVNAVVAEPLLPPVVGRTNAVLMRHVLRLELTAELILNRGNAFRAGHRREAGLKQAELVHPFPTAVAGADRNVGVACTQVTQ